ncbi:PepSY-associated TM helix domain-containing protein [Micromonospora sp. SH-82]|uniref:PepSY-associated TM helix domain-containing protein n=1 Tax=Micromonospora sp. SH-82 TaxID=3132938 RepID=UPI003EB97E71
MSLAPELPKTAPSTPPPAGPPGRRNPTSGAGALLLRLHFYAGVLVAPFIVVAALTGLLYTVVPQLDAVVYRQELFVDAVGDQPRPLAEQIAAARAAHPDGALTSVTTPAEPDRTTEVVFSLPELGEKSHTVYVDPYTGAVKGQLVTWFGSTPVTTWIDDLHRNLHLGDLGRHYSELAASWLWVVALGGVVLWWRRSRGRRFLVPDLKARKGVRRTRGWHAAVGVWLLAGLLVLSATGLTWSRYAGANFGSALDVLDARTPQVSTSLTGAPAVSGGHHGAAPVAAEVDPADADTVLGVARDAGLSGPVTVTPPAEATSAWRVGQVDQVWPTRADVVAVDPSTGTVTDRVDHADWPVLAKLTSWGILVHMGVLFGAANQIVLAALAVGLLCVTFWGYRMWWQRRPTRDGRRALVGAAPARGAWDAAPTWLILVGVPVSIAVGLALPLLGVSLLGFLVVDVVVGLLRSRRAGAPTAS